jgi:hypothetical protein
VSFRAAVAASQQPPFRREVQLSDELRRIAEIPRRVWTPEKSEELAEIMSSLLRSKDGQMSLRPIQAVTLHDMCAYDGTVCMARTGAGKSLISFLAPYVCEAHRPILIIPANLRLKTERDLQQYRKHWEISPMITIQTYETLARAGSALFLELLRPDLIICDEAHHLKNTKAAVTRRIKRYVEECEAGRFGGKSPKMLLLSGTFTNRSITEYWHLLKWCLPRAQVPLPLNLEELDNWRLALDEKVPTGQRMKPGALAYLFSEEDKELAKTDPLRAARRAYSRRLVETPGVVATTETFMGSRLEVRDIRIQRPESILKAFRRLRTDWELPDGEPVADALLVSKAAKELSLGFFYRWNPRPPEDWVEARRDWCRFVRSVLTRNNRNLDTEDQVKQAVLEGFYDSEKLEEWQKIKDTFEVKVEAVWIDDFAVRAAADWAVKRKGIVWVGHVAFGRRLSKLTGLPYYGEGGFDEKGSFIESHPKKEPLIASIKANMEGKNLQNWDENLVCSPPSSGKWWEQLISRTHRDGQTSAVVKVDMLASCIEHYQCFHQALADAEYVQDTTPMIQRLLYADVFVPGIADVEAELSEAVVSNAQSDEDLE